MATKVYVWETRAHILHADPDFGDHGHSSALVGSTYISFWPSDDTGKKPKKVAINSRRPYYVESYSEDCSADTMKRSADHTIEIRNLNERAMLAYWQKVKADRRKFHFLASNCSTIVGKMLMEGWNSTSQDFFEFLGGLYAHLQSLLSDAYYWEPSDVLRVARTIKDAKG